jgi:isopentenyldiphosphate isomerase
MSYLDRIRACHSWRPENYRPFVLAGDTRPLGWVAEAFAGRLRDFPRVFEVTDKAVTLPARFGDFETRSAVLEETLRALHDSGEIPKWRGEDYGISRRWGQAPLFRMERGAVPLFGVPAFGVHVNGYVETADGLRIWVAKRARNKTVAPGKFDHLTAGGQPYGLGLLDNVVKECAEEAGVPPHLAARARPVGAIRYICERSEGLRNDIAFCFDLALPEAFQPEPADGEVEAFFLWTPEQVLEHLRDSDDFKFNVALVNLHFALRHGVLNPDSEPEYQKIVDGLQGRFED